MRRPNKKLFRTGLRLVTALALIFAMTLCLAACGSSSDNDELNLAEEAEETVPLEDTDAAEGSEAEEENEDSEENEEETDADADLIETTDSEDTVDVVFWHYYDSNLCQKNINALCEEYNELQDVVNIIPEFHPREELDELLCEGVVNGDLPDLAMVDCSDMSYYISLGIFDDITEELEKWGELDNYYEINLASCEGPDGEIYGLPFDTNCLCLAVNLDLLRDAGYDSGPTSSDELYDIAVATTNPSEGIYGYGMTLIDAEDGTFSIYPWLRSQYNGETTNIDDLTAESAVHGLSFLSSLVESGAMSSECANGTQTDAWNKFCNGELAMSTVGTWNMTDTEDIHFDWEVVPLPTGDEGTSSSTCGGENIGVCVGAVEEDACIDFIEWLTGADNEAEWGKVSGYLSTRKDAEPDYEDYKESYDVFQDELNYASVRGPHPDWPTISEAIYTAGRAAVVGGESAETALSTATETIRPLLEKYQLAE